ncbi:MAG: hypothetical protein ACYDAX_08140 [Desulfobacteria bacterium]
MTVRVKFALTETVSPTRMIPRTEGGFQVELPERHGELDVEGDLFAGRRVPIWFLLPVGLLAGWGCAQKMPIHEGRMVDDPQEELSEASALPFGADASVCIRRLTPHRPHGIILIKYG